MASDFLVATTHTRLHGRKLQKKTHPTKFFFFAAFILIEVCPQR